MTTLLTILRDLAKGNPKRTPGKPIPMERIEKFPVEASEQTKVIWFGHSTVLLEIAGRRILFDPTFSDSPSPFPMVGGKRFSRKIPIEPEQLPPIDLVLLSHDHYDHMDYHSIKKLKNKTSLFCVPSGVGRRLLKWGVDREKVREFKWWNELEFAGLTLVCTPAKHFSGRSMFDRNTTLWCSWVVAGPESKVFFSGDGGYGSHFTQIGNKYGPFDLTLMECGQYDRRWADIHMMPEETVQAHSDVQGRMLLPIHWAAFSLAFHNWTDPIERVIKAAKEQSVCLTTPKIGEIVTVGSETIPQSTWWR